MPSLTGVVPPGLLAQVAHRPDVEVVAVKGVSPVGRARNEGLSRVTGDYIAWMDADDEVTEDWLAEISAAIEERPDVVVIGHVWHLSATDVREKVWAGEDLLGDVLSQFILCSEMWNFVVRRELWEGVRFDDSARTMEDWDVAPRFLAKAHRIVNVRKALYRYFAREGSLTHCMNVSIQREIYERAVARIDEVRRLGLWKRYGRITLGGVGYMVYYSAEPLAFAGETQSGVKRDAERWIRRHLAGLLYAPTRVTFKVKWVLAALGAWRVVEWWYARRDRKNNAG